MSLEKRLLHEYESKLLAGSKIAIAANVLGFCKAHGSIYRGTADVKSAYMLGNYRFSTGLLDRTFDDRREMTDYIKQAVEAHSAKECRECARKIAA